MRKLMDMRKLIVEPKSFLPFFILCAIALNLISFYTLCRADQESTVGNSLAEEFSEPAPAKDDDEVSAIDRRKAEEKVIREKAFGITPHRQNYVLAIAYDSNPNVEAYEFGDLDEPKNSEVKFQLSIKMLLWENIFKGNGDLFAAYTQLCFWQLYDEALSSPFRETNYEPEAFLKFDTDFNVLGLKNRFFLIGFNHESNGRGGEVLSRSWNRVYASFVAERGNFVIGLKPWYRIPEDDEDDDNPSIEKYMGYGELFGAYRLEEHVFSFLFRNNLRRVENKGAAELGWSYPISHNLRIYVQYFNGYGESLIDYNHHSNRIGAGLMLFDWI